MNKAAYLDEKYYQNPYSILPPNNPYKTDDVEKYTQNVDKAKELLKEAGVPYHIPVVPLFETLDDLDASEGVMRQLFNIGWYRGVINNHQMVMIGYSDSAKDAGKMAASWGTISCTRSISQFNRRTGY